jgi:DnaJ-class molecular chaperone
MATERNLYRLLGVAETATPHEIRQAYELARHTYGGDSLATYSLFGAEDRQAVMAQIEEAYRVLGNPERRRAYDAGVANAGAPVEAVDTAGLPAKSDADSDRPEPPDAATLLEATIPDVITGRDLKQLRESRRMSLQTIADLTRINIKYLQYLEDDQHSKLPHPVFIRSYLLQYAKVLKLDADRLFAAYQNNMKGQSDA